MARRRQTTGLPKKSRKDNNDEQMQDSSFLNRLLGHPSNRAEYEEALNKLILRSTYGFLAILTAAILLFLVYQYVYVPYFVSVATVNGERIAVTEFRERVRFEQALVLQQAQSRLAQVQQFVGQGTSKPILTTRPTISTMGTRTANWLIFSGSVY